MASKHKAVVSDDLQLSSLLSNAQKNVGPRLAWLGHLVTSMDRIRHCGLSKSLGSPKVGEKFLQEKGVLLPGVQFSHF